MTLESRNAATMRSAQARYDNASDPRLEVDDDDDTRFCEKCGMDLSHVLFSRKHNCRPERDDE